MIQLPRRTVPTIPTALTIPTVPTVSSRNLPVRPDEKVAFATDAQAIGSFTFAPIFPASPCPDRYGHNNTMSPGLEQERTRRKC